MHFLELTPKKMALVLLGSCLLTAGAVGQEVAGKYVVGSRVPIRIAPNTVQPPLGYLIANTPIKVLHRQGEWCEILAENEKLQGYCLCKYLDDRPLDVSAILRKIKNKDYGMTNYADDASRVFWLSPSLTNFEMVGAALERKLLSQETRLKESLQPRINRFKVPEYEAMKEVLSNGIVSTIKPDWVSEIGLNAIESLARAKKFIALPKIRKSFFDSQDVFALPGSPFGLERVENPVQMIDWLSAANHSRFAVEFVKPASYNIEDFSSNSNRNGIFGLQYGGIVRVGGYEGPLGR